MTLIGFLQQRNFKEIEIFLLFQLTCIYIMRNSIESMIILLNSSLQDAELIFSSQLGYLYSIVLLLHI